MGMVMSTKRGTMNPVVVGSNLHILTDLVCRGADEGLQQLENI